MLSTIELTVDGQKLIGKSIKTASNLIGEVICIFTFEGDEWGEFDKVNAVFHNIHNGKRIETEVVDNQTIIPYEVLAQRGEVFVNLYAYNLDSVRGIKTIQMTSYKTKIVDVIQKVNVFGENTNPTPIIWRAELEKEKYERTKGDNVNIEKLNHYLYKATYKTLPNTELDDAFLGACSSYVKDGKLHRNLDWEYNENISFIVGCPDFTGMAFGIMDDINTLPYKVVDGVNKHGIMVSTHVLFNDWEWNGQGSTPLHKLPFTALSTMESIEDIANLPLDDLCPTPSLYAKGYIAQFIITDGITSYAVMPSTEDNIYVYEEMGDNAKMTNFRWLNVAQASRDMEDIQLRPTGIERYNLMPCDMEDIEFTKAYQSPNRLSEFIGVDDTTKYSTDSELVAIYNQAHVEYIHRARNGETWQTMHSVVYGSNGIEHLYVQEDWDNDYGVGKDSTKEDKANKVINISESSTDAEYPSAKAVYDFVMDLIDNN